MNRADAAQNRHGTRRYCAYLMALARGNFVAGGRVALLCKPRTNKKAWKYAMAHGSVPPQGRVLRAATRAVLDGLSSEAVFRTING